MWIIGVGVFGVGIYGFLNCLLILIGLYYVLNSLVWFVFGDYYGVMGDLNCFFKGDLMVGIFMSGFFLVMMFGLLVVVFVMVVVVKKEKCK